MSHRRGTLWAGVDCCSASLPSLPSLASVGASHCAVHPTACRLQAAAVGGLPTGDTTGMAAVTFGLSGPGAAAQAAAAAAIKPSGRG